MSIEHILGPTSWLWSDGNNQSYNFRPSPKWVEGRWFWCSYSPGRAGWPKCQNVVCKLDFDLCSASDSLLRLRFCALYKFDLHYITLQNQLRPNTVWMIRSGLIWYFYRQLLYQGLHFFSTQCSRPMCREKRPIVPRKLQWAPQNRRQWLAVANIYERYNKTFKWIENTRIHRHRRRTDRQTYRDAGSKWSPIDGCSIVEPGELRWRTGTWAALDGKVAEERNVKVFVEFVDGRSNWHCINTSQ